jgi:hypothetical protein
MGVKSHLLFSFGGHSKQAGDERHLPKDICFVHSLYLSLPDQVHHLVSLQGSPCGVERKETHSLLNHPFNEAMILLNQIIKVLDLPQFDLFGKHSRSFELFNGFGIGRILIDVDHARNRRGGVRISRGRLGHLFLNRVGVRS